MYCSKFLSEKDVNHLIGFFDEVTTYKYLLSLVISLYNLAQKHRYKYV